MKVLIIENDANKLDNAIRIVKKSFKSAKIVHINNFNDAYKACYKKSDIDEFDLIILDMVFCRAKPYEGTDPVKHRWAGSMFLSHLAKRKSTIPVIIYSTEANYLEKYKEYLFPAFQTFCYNYDSYPLFVEDSTVGKLYNEATAVAQELLEASDFVIGHAHTHTELGNIIRNHWNIMKKAGYEVNPK